MLAAPLPSGTHLWPRKVRTGRDVLRMSYRYTLWSAEPSASSCDDPGRHRTAHTLALVSICSGARRRVDG